MDAGARAPSGSSYEEFKPRTRWVSEEGVNTFLIVIDVPEFKNENLTVQVTKSRTLKISGQLLISDNTWEVFVREVQVPENCDASKATAKLQHGTLHIRLPRITTLDMKGKAALKAQGSEQAAASSRPPPQPAPSQRPPRDLKINGSVVAERKPAEANKAEARVYHTTTASHKKDMGEKPDRKKIDTEENKSVNPERQSFSSVVSRSRMLNSCFFTELKKPENLKKAITIVISGAAAGLFITGMLKWYGHGKQELRIANGE